MKTKGPEILHQDADPDKGIDEAFSYMLLDGAQVRVYELPLPTGRTVTFRELTVNEFEACMREGGDDGWKISQAGLRRSLLKINDKPVTYDMVMGGLLANMFRMKEMMLLRAAWDKVNMVSEEDMDVVRGLRVG